MSPAQHIEWFEDNISWFGERSASSLSTEVPACPGWTVETVITHLTYGLGLGYPLALAAPANASQSEAFDALRMPASLPTGPAALAEFARTMNACVMAFKAIDPLASCYTYAGPGVAAFWFRRAAIETTLHRMDVVEALGLGDAGLADERADDAIIEAIEFALPLAAQWASVEPPAVHVRLGERVLQLGEGTPTAEISGGSTSLLAALWGRSSEGIAVDGDQRAAQVWLSVVEQGFGGR